MAEREHVLQLLSVSRVVPFEFSAEDGLFSFGEQRIGAEHVPAFGTLHTSEQEITPEAIDRWSASRAYLAYRHPIATRVGQEAIESLWTVELAQDTRRIMAEVLAGPEAEREVAPEFWLQDASPLQVNQHRGRLSLRTAGNCACMGVDYTVREGWRAEGFSEYTPHNIDNPRQHVSLLAGIGHIARIANQHIARAGSGVSDTIST